MRCHYLHSFQEQPLSSRPRKSARNGLNLHRRHERWVAALQVFPPWFDVAIRVFRLGTCEVTHFFANFSRQGLCLLICTCMEHSTIRWQVANDILQVVGPVIALTTCPLLFQHSGALLRMCYFYHSTLHAAPVTDASILFCLPYLVLLLSLYIFLLVYLVVCIHCFICTRSIFS